MPDIEWLLHAAARHRPLRVDEHTTVADDNWQGSIERLELDAGLRIFLVAVQVARDMVVEPRNGSETPWLASQISIAGTLTYRFADGVEAHVAPKRAMLFRPSVKAAVLHLRGGQRLRLAGYAFDLDRVQRLFDGDVPQPLRPLFEPELPRTRVVETRSGSNLRRIAENLFAPGLNGPLRILFLEGIALQLMAIQIAAAEERQRDRDPPISIRERDLLEEARRHLLADMRSPPTLGVLAAAVGLTERRLNAGFRAMYGMTAFELLRDERLEHARIAILTESVPLKDIAYRVGYIHVTNFVNAFTARFGAPPRSYAQRLPLPSDATEKEKSG